MKAILVNDDRRLRWDDVPDPVMGEDDCLIKIEAAAVNRAEEHGFDPSQLLPYDTPFWFAAHASLLSLLALDVLAFLAWRRSRSQPESPR